ncbi:serine/threonine-protein phosphatase [Streptomyces sp. ISL-94]|nr:serine/threonine-protein phosphatase [Streptomyces sp. ISL-94]
MQSRASWIARRAIPAPPAFEARGLGGGAPAAAPQGASGCAEQGPASPAFEAQRCGGGAPAAALQGAGQKPAPPACEARAGAEPGRSAQRARHVQVLDGETLPPLGVVPVPADAQPHPVGRLRPGETLFLHTDGAEEARDAAGAFFPLRSVLAEAPAPLTPARLVAGVHAALLRHTGGRLADDVALLVLRDDSDRS